MEVANHSPDRIKPCDRGLALPIFEPERVIHVFHSSVLGHDELAIDHATTGYWCAYFIHPYSIPLLEFPCTKRFCGHNVRHLCEDWKRTPRAAGFAAEQRYRSSISMPIAFNVL